MFVVLIKRILISLCRPFKCQFCDRRFYRKNILKLHEHKCKFENRSNISNSKVSDSYKMEIA